MPNEFQAIFPFILMAAGVGMVGGVLAFFWAPGVNSRSAVQHFAAGVVIGAVASDLVPEVEKIGSPSGILGGFAAGGLAMIGLKWLVLKFEKKEKAKHQLPVGIAVAAAVDTLIDGAMISAGFSSGRQLGALLAVALAVELFFLNLSVGTEFHKQKSKSWQGVAVTTAIAFLLLLGSAVGFLVLRGVSKPTLAVFLSFGAAALIYLVAGELLVESIQAEESPFSTAMLFAGFLVVLAFKLIGPEWNSASTQLLNLFPFHPVDVVCSAILLRP